MSDPGPRSATPAGRRAWILATLRADGFLSVADLARRLGVSQMTIRRDLHSLVGTHAVRLVHGGASLSPGALGNPAFPEDAHTVAREQIARHALRLIGRADAIAIDAGSTGYAVARALPEDFTGCIVTHSLPVLQLLAEDGRHRVVSLGGELLHGRRAFAGPTTEAAVADLRVRTFFLSPCAVDSRGVYAQSPAEAGVQRRLMEIADEVVLVSTEESFRTSAPALVSPLGGVTAMISNRQPPAELSCALRRAGVVAHVAGS